MDTVIRFRVATEEKALLEAAAKREGLTFSEWARLRLLGVARGETVPVVGAPPGVRVQSVEFPGEPKKVSPVRPMLDEKSKAMKRQTDKVNLKEDFTTGRGSLKRSVDIPKPDWKG